MKSTRRRLTRKTPFIVCCLLLIILLAGCYVLKDKVLPVEPGNSFIPSFKQERVNVLLLGVDAREGETTARTDSIILASIDQKSKQMSLLSIPRDTRVNIPGHGYDKINSASVYGGPELSMKVASELLGIPVKNYVLVNFSGFKDIVDALGGVTLDVEQNMYHWDPEDKGAYQINLKKGVQRLDGDKALQYVRYRDYVMGDIDRTKYQQKFLVALAKEMLQPSTIPKLPKLVTEINRYVKTNLSASYLYTLASAARNLENGNIVTQTLPGRPVNINGGSYWGVNPSEARQVVTKLFNGETVTNIVLDTPLSSPGTGSSGSKTATKPKTDQKPAATVDQDQQQAGTKTQQTTDRTGQTNQKSSGSSSSSTESGTVKITPGDTQPETRTGTNTGKTGSSTTGTGGSTTGTQSGTGTSKPGGTSSSVNTGQAGTSISGIQGTKT
ncbi:MAG: putative transcriptional regulator YwtF [Pelotomaculum sp. PtaB.Bin104]|nr:MAG: putative transcriptional regulator YwtF [Pelotomaculum sp. PtaB.Bin104]